MVFFYIYSFFYAVNLLTTTLYGFDLLVYLCSGQYVLNNLTLVEYFTFFAIDSYKAFYQLGIIFTKKYVGYSENAIWVKLEFFEDIWGVAYEMVTNFLKVVYKSVDDTINIKLKEPTKFDIDFVTDRLEEKLHREPTKIEIDNECIEIQHRKQKFEQIEVNCILAIATYAVTMTIILLAAGYKNPEDFFEDVAAALEAADRNSKK